MRLVTITPFLILVYILAIIFYSPGEEIVKFNSSFKDTLHYWDLVKPNKYNNYLFLTFASKTFASK